jgi:hypothetical protein
MNEIQFCYWLKGFFESIAASGLEPVESPMLLASISARLAVVKASTSSQRQLHPLTPKLQEMSFVIKHSLSIAKLEPILAECFTDFIDEHNREQSIGVVTQSTFRAIHADR